MALEENITVFFDDDEIRVDDKEKMPNIMFSPGQVVVFNGKNCVFQSGAKSMGEADVYTVKIGSRIFFFKYYKHNMPLRKGAKEVLARIKNNPQNRIVKIIDLGSYNNRDYEITEFAEAGTLRDVMDSYTIRNDEDFKNIVRMINEGLLQLHGALNIIHQDLKPDNIVFKDAKMTQIALTDFGASNIMETGEKKANADIVMTLAYAAPEILPKLGMRSVIATPAIDYYSLGITMLEMWMGENPFKGISKEERDCMKFEGKVPFPADMPDDYKRLIQGLIKPNPRERWGNNEIQQWLYGYLSQTDTGAWVSRGGKVCNDLEEIVQALTAESAYYKEELKKTNTSLYMYFTAVEGEQGAEMASVFCKLFEEYPAEQAFSNVCAMLRGEG
jgi:serine/threonine protein kinase